MKKIFLMGAAVGMTLASSLQPASAVGPANNSVYVNQATGDNANAASPNFCQIKTPCADIVTALGLLTTTNGGTVNIAGGGTFGPITVPAMSNSTLIAIIGDGTGIVIINGNAPGSSVTACPGAASGCASGTNNGYALEVNTGGAPSTSVRLKNIILGAGGGVGAVHIASVGNMAAQNVGFRGNGSITGPIILINPSVGTSNQMYLKNCDIGFSNGGGVLLQPTGATNARVAFIDAEIHNASFGIKGDATLASAGSGVSMSLANSSFFAMSGAGVTALSSSGAGNVNAVLNNLNIFSVAAAAYNNNGPNSFGILTNVTFAGNAKGVSIGGGGVSSSGNNTITGNGTVVGGVFTPADVVGGSLNVVATK